CFLLRREAIEAAGLFDEDFVAYSEETDLQLRIRKAGWRAWFTPHGLVTHYGGQSSGKLDDGGFHLFHDSLERYFRKHYGQSGLLLLKGAMVLEACIKLGAVTVFPNSAALRHWDPSGSKARLYRTRLK